MSNDRNLPANQQERTETNPHVVTVLVVLTGVVSGSWLIIVVGALWHLSNILGWRDVFKNRANKSIVARHYSRKATDMWDAIGNTVLDILGIEEWDDEDVVIDEEQPAVVVGRSASHAAPASQPVPTIIEQRDDVAAPPAMPALLDELEGEQAILVVGAKGSGKTTVLSWILHGVNDAVIFDPHNAPVKWSGRPVIGGGRNYKNIEKGLNHIEQMMDKRYKLMDQGKVQEGQFKPLWVCIDEGRSIMIKTKSAGPVFTTLLTEARKVEMNVVLANHSSLVGALGLEGASDLKEGLVLVHLRNVNGVRKAMVDKGEGPYEVRLPGAYIPRTSSRQNRPFQARTSFQTPKTAVSTPRTSSEPPARTSVGTTQVESEPARTTLGTTLREKAILIMIGKGYSNNQICKELSAHGLGKSRQQMLTEINEIRDEVKHIPTRK